MFMDWEDGDWGDLFRSEFSGLVDGKVDRVKLNPKIRLRVLQLLFVRTTKLLFTRTYLINLT